MCTRNVFDTIVNSCHSDASCISQACVDLRLSHAHDRFAQGEVDTDGKPHGAGKFQWLVSGAAGDTDALYDVYEGQWHSGMMHGAGKKVWATGISSFNKP